MGEGTVQFRRKKAFATLYREVAQDERLSLESRGLLESSAMVQNCGLPGEQAAESLKDAPQSGSYFTTLLVP